MGLCNASYTNIVGDSYYIGVVLGVKDVCMDYHFNQSHYIWTVYEKEIIYIISRSCIGWPQQRFGVIL